MVTFKRSEIEENTKYNWFARNSKQQILLSKTREEIAYNYARKDDVRDDITKLMDALHRLEDKLDKVLSK